MRQNPFRYLQAPRLFVVVWAAAAGIALAAAFAGR
jgi:hypothetical protein